MNKLPVLIGLQVEFCSQVDAKDIDDRIGSRDHRAVSLLQSYMAAKLAALCEDERTG